MRCPARNVLVDARARTCVIALAMMLSAQLSVAGSSSVEV
jgi:hypothetical protein